MFCQVSLLKECDHPNVIRLLRVLWNSTETEIRTAERKWPSDCNRLFVGFTMCFLWIEPYTWCLSTWTWLGPRLTIAGCIVTPIHVHTWSHLYTLQFGTKDLRIFLKRTEFAFETHVYAAFRVFFGLDDLGTIWEEDIGRNGAFRNPHALKNAAFQCIRWGLSFEFSWFCDRASLFGWCLPSNDGTFVWSSTPFCPGFQFALASRIQAQVIQYMLLNHSLNVSKPTYAEGSHRHCTVFPATNRSRRRHWSLCGSYRNHE